MIDAYGVVGRLCQLMQDAHTASGHGGGCEYGCTEVFFADGLRAGESEEYAARFDLLESLDIEFSVALQGVTQCVAVLGKCRRVQDDEVVLVTHAVEILEGILCIGCMTAVTGKVQLYVLVCQINGFCRAVYGVHQVGIATHGVDRKATGVAEHVQYIAPIGIAFQQ